LFYVKRKILAIIHLFVYKVLAKVVVLLEVSPFRGEKVVVVGVVII
jgi:hypothetical protein